MQPEQRQQLILARARLAGRVGVTALADELQVAAETVRRDLRILESQGLLRRTYGGGYPVETVTFESGVEYRSHNDVPQKRRIASKAVSFLGEAETVFVDEGFTPQLIAEELTRIGRPLHVVTASLLAASVLARSSSITVELAGGLVRGRTMGSVGPWTTELLGRLVIDVAYVGANGVSREHGMTTPDPVVGAVKAQAIASSRRRVFVGTHRKFGISSFHRFAELAEFELLVTDCALSAAEAKRYAALGPRVVRA
jgi:DeoR family transcriptional regulator, fructose operon transcriptional repressor